MKMSSQQEFYTTKTTERLKPKSNSLHSSLSYSSLSGEEFMSINDSNRLTSTFSLRNCGGKRKRMCLNYKLGSSRSLDKNSFFNDSRSSNSYGLTENLSSESIRNVCEYVDDELSDNDLIEIQSTPSNFKNQHGHRKWFEDSKFDKKKKSSQETQLFPEVFHSNEILHQHDDAFDALKELDAVLDIHGSSSYINQPSIDCGQANIEDCLLELDDYLEKMDECDEEGVQNDNSNVKTNDNFQRRSRLRKTISSAFESDKSDNSQSHLYKATPIYATWCQHPVRNLEQSKMVSLEQNVTNKKNVEVDNKQTTQLSYSDNSSSAHTASNADEPRLFSQSDNDLPSNSIQVLTQDQIFQNLIEQSVTNQAECSSRPRQFGRRAERYPRRSTPEGNIFQDSISTNYYNRRPMSAPAGSEMPITEPISHNPMSYIGSDGSTARSSRNTSPVSIDSISDSGESSAISNNIIAPNLIMNEETPQQIISINAENAEATQKPGFNSYWPHNYTRTLALISCTLGLFNICRFAVLTINYGGNFLIQFLILSIIFGIPFVWLQMCLGAKIRSGPISMWKISPICSGIGISLVLVQYFVTIYSSVAIVWLLVYIGDTFIYNSSYRWSDSIYTIIPRQSSHTYTNLTESVPDYFNINVLQRHQILKVVDVSGVRLHISDRLAFYLAIMWATVFIILCKGLKSLGKVLLVVGFVPLMVLAVITGKFLSVVDLAKLQNVFSSSELDDFLINSRTWTAAAQETFLTWGLFGASIIAITSRTHKKFSKVTLRSDAILVVLVTLIGLCMSSMLGMCCIQILNQSGFVYVPGSYENPETYSAIYSLKSSSNSELISYPSKFVPHYSSLIGEVYRRQSDIKNISGYQALRFVSEIIPAVVAISKDKISWIWAAILFITLFVFGMAQLCVMWKPISSALGNSTSAVLLSCVTGLLLSIPFATEIGITLLHYMDIVLGGAWFIPILWTSQIFGVFLIRGRPYNGDDLVNDLKMSGSMSAFLALSWNVLLPIGLITLAVIEYKASVSSQLYYWRGSSYFNYFARKMGALTQIGFLLLVPITAIIQIYRYLTSGPPDILDRIQLLYRPQDENDMSRPINRANRNTLDSRYPHENNGNITDTGISNVQDDAPPKYTPPPSYTTATGARLAKLLRQSIRRSVRRILGESGRRRPILSIQQEMEIEHSSFPPDYSTIVTNASAASIQRGPSISETIEIENRSPFNYLNGRSMSLGRKQISQKSRRGKRTAHRPASAPRDMTLDTLSRRQLTRIERPYTAEDVITILRSSTIGRRRTSHSNQPHSEFVFCSAENLVTNAEPPGLSSAMVDDYNNENIEIENTTTVI